MVSKFGSSPSPRGEDPHFQVPFSLVFGGVLAADGEASAGWSPEPPCKTPEKIKSRNERSILPRNHYNPWWKPCKTKTRLGWYVFLWLPLTPSATKLKDPPQQQGSFKAESMPRRWNEWKIESSTGRKWKRKKSWLLAFSHEKKKTDQTWFSNWLFQRKADQIWWYWPKETTLIEKSEFHEDGIFAYIYHKDQPKCRSTYLYIYIYTSYMEYLSMFFDVDCKWIVKYSTHGAFGKGFCLLLFPEDQSRWVYVGWPRKGSLGRLLGGSPWDLFSWLVGPWLVVVP